MSVSEKTAGHDPERSFHKKAANALQVLLILVLIALTICMMREVQNIQGDARVVNYAGILRGATQRAVKLEVVQQGDDELIDYLDDIFSGLLHGGGKYELTKLDDADYQEKLQTQYENWRLLKDEIEAVREKGYEQTDIIPMSEAYFHLADLTVGAAETYSQRCATRVRVLERALAVVMAAIILLLIHQSVQEVVLRRRNLELRKKAYIDLHTGLPNKSRCEELLMDRAPISEPTAVAVFDLNGLKQVNDTLGHLAGDTLIANFANVLRTSIPEQHFVGRYGGDEFLAILHDVDREDVDQILSSIREHVTDYNASGKKLRIEFACGCSLSSDFGESTLKILLEQADRKMYVNKKAMKAHAGQA